MTKSLSDFRIKFVLYDKDHGFTMYYLEFNISGVVHWAKE